VKFKIKNKMPFTLAFLKMKYLGKSQTKYGQDLYQENKILTEEIKELNKWRYVPCLQMGRDILSRFQFFST
jgi:hypothetical protein